MLVEREACCHVANAFFKGVHPGANLAHFQAEVLQTVQKMRFLRKASGVNGLNRNNIQTAVISMAKQRAVLLKTLITDLTFRCLLRTTRIVL